MPLTFKSFKMRISKLELSNYRTIEFRRVFPQGKYTINLSFKCTKAYSARGLDLPGNRIFSGLRQTLR